jgi:hypothetical protein
MTGLERVIDELIDGSLSAESAFHGDMPSLVDPVPDYEDGM